MATRPTHASTRPLLAGLVLILALFAWLGGAARAQTGPGTLVPMGAETGAQTGSDTIQPLRFARGASGMDVRGAVIRGEQALYSLEARQGQRLSLRITSPENNAVFQLYVPGARPQMRDSILEIAGEALPGAGEGNDTTEWAGALPRSGAYLLVIGGTRGNAEFHLIVSIK